MGRYSNKKRQREPTLPLVDEATEVKELEEQVLARAPPRGTQPFTEANRDRERFSTLSLSQRTLRGLTDASFKTMTEIQVAAIPHALAGRDVLGAAKTGSGKTLAFLVPLVEKLYRSRITFGDGLAALVISPTRELSLQIFEVLRLFAKHHQLSAGLITGGKKEFREEQASVIRMNILVATPGRLLQHLEQTPGFDASLLQVLVLDEADRILDLGFRDQLNSVLEYLPPSRQSMLFSATQTKSVKDLARLSLRKDNVEYVAVRAGKDECATPAKLVQNYVVCELDKKLDVLLGFIKTHIKSKMIVFFTSCAQVRFAFELLCALQPGTPVMALHGKCKHARRTQIYLDFVRRPGAVLLATDIAARGLDFPSVDWVIQVDAPEDCDGYIHRVGRTARYNSNGRALMLLLPSEEEGVVAALKPKNIPMKKLTINPEKVRMSGSVGKKASALVASNADKKRLAEKSFTSYVRAMQLMPNKEAFQLSELPLEAYAFSLGLAATPRVPGLAKALSEPSAKVITGGVNSEDADGEGGVGKAGEGVAAVEQEREAQRKKKNVNRSLQRLKEQIKAEKLRKKMERAEMTEKDSGRQSSRMTKPKTTLTSGDIHDSGSGSDDSSDEDSEDNGGLVLVKKGRVAGGDREKGEGRSSETEESESESGLLLEGKKKEKTMKMRITKDGVVATAVGLAKKKVFDVHGEAMDVVSPLQAFANDAQIPDIAKSHNLDLPTASEEYVRKIKARLEAVDDNDKARERERVREKHLKRRHKDKDKEKRHAGATATLSGASYDEEIDSDSDENVSSDDEYDNQSEGDDGENVSEDSESEGSESESDKRDDACQREEDGGDCRNVAIKRRRTGGARSGRDHSTISVKDQEDVVLQLLGARRGLV